MFSVGVQWTELEQYLSHEFNREIIRVLGNGVCFIRSVKHCLSRDLDVNYTIDEISDKIFEEVCDNAEEYSKFHTNSKRQLISDMLKYLNDRIYTIDIIDVAVQACANALKVNLYIYKWTGPKVILIPTYSKIASNRNIFLLYNQLGGSVHGGNHYSAIVEPKASPKEITNIVSNVQQNQNVTNSNTNDEGESEKSESGRGVADLHANVSGVCNKCGDEFHCGDGDYLYDEFGEFCGASEGNSADDCSGDGVQLGTTAKEGNQMTDLTNDRSETNTNNLHAVNSTINDDSDVEIVDNPVDLEEGIPIPANYIHEKRPKRQKYRKRFINYVKFAQMDSVHVDEIPWDVDRDQKYTIECEEDEYIDKSKDGCWFKMHTSSCKGLDG